MLTIQDQVDHLNAITEELLTLRHILHRQEQHPDWEYETTLNGLPPFDGNSWESNLANHPREYEFGTEHYWRRKKEADDGTA